MKYFFFLLLIALSSNTGFTKSPVDIKITYENYDNDTLLVAYHYGEKILIQDSLFAHSKGKFHYKKDSLLEPGMYMLVAKPNNTFFQFLVGDDQQFEISTDFQNDRNTVIKGSEENEAFYDYIKYLSGQREQLAGVDSLLANNKIKEAEAKSKKGLLAEKVEEYQRELIDKYKGTMFAMIIAANMSLDVPNFQGSEEEKEIQRYNFYRQEYLKSIDLGNPTTLRSPFLHKKIEFFVDKLTPLEADSIKGTLDMLLSRMEGAPKTYQYYLSHFLNKYANSKYIGLDAVYVHLALNYYDKGKAHWAKAENLEEIVNNAKSMEPTLIGKLAPDFTTLEENGDEFNLHTFKAKYTVLVFWAPDCGHCTKAMPFLVDFQEKYKEEGARVVSICNQVGKKYESCWSGVKEKNMMTFLNTGDQYMRSRVLSKYYVKSTPLILLLDENKNILLKKIPAENIDGIMENVLEVDAKKAEKAILMKG